MNRCFRTTWLSAGVLLTILFTVSWRFAGLAGAASVCKKETPEITFGNLSPPYKQYEYFQHHQMFPFAYDASSFSLVNAWWLAEASMLVYADEAYVNQRFRRAGLNRIQFFDRPSTQCYLAANDRFAIVAFRGSEIWKRGDGFEPRRMIADLTTNIDIRLSEWNNGASVHRGFKAALEDVWDELRPQIEQLQARGLKIWITGHSLGAALATLAADRLPEVQGLYTFGSPRVGDEIFQAGFKRKAFRMVNGRDIVASVPPKGPYYHVGAFIPIDSQGGVHYRHASFGKQSDTDFQDDADGNEPVQASTKIDSAVFIPRSVRDHVPLLYAISLWNELVESLNSNGNP